MYMCELSEAFLAKKIAEAPNRTGIIMHDAFFTFCIAERTNARTEDICIQYLRVSPMQLAIMIA